MFDKQTKKFVAAVVEALPETPQDIMQGWIGNPKGLQKVLREALLPPAESILHYPTWVREHLTPELEKGAICNPGDTELWIGLPKTTGNLPFLNDVYTALEEAGLLGVSLSYADLVWYEKNLDQIPADWRGKMIYAWASVVRGHGTKLYVPYLACDVQHGVYWNWLGCSWSNNLEFAGLRRVA